MKGEKRAWSWKVGGKDEINSRVYGALKVAGISLTTWQTATVVVLLAGGLKCIDECVVRSLPRECGSCANASSGYHSFILERAARVLLMTVPWNYCGTSRPPGWCARRKMREREEKVNPPREIPPTDKDYLSPRGGGSLSLLAVRFLPLSISHHRVSSPAAFSMFAASERRTAP